MAKKWVGYNHSSRHRNRYILLKGKLIRKCLIDKKSVRTKGEKAAGIRFLIVRVDRHYMYYISE